MEACANEMTRKMTNIVESKAKDFCSRRRRVNIVWTDRKSNSCKLKGEMLGLLSGNDSLCSATKKLLANFQCRSFSDSLICQKMTTKTQKDAKKNKMLIQLVLLQATELELDYSD